MQYDPQLLELLASIPAHDWGGRVYRHMFAGLPPERENTVGARWNPPEVPAIYSSLSREGALAEAEYQISLEPLRPLARRTLHVIELRLASVIDLSDYKLLARLGLTRAHVQDEDYSACQQVGGAVERLEHDGMMVPSARSDALHMVIFPNRQTSSYRFEPVAAEIIHDPSGRTQ